MLGRDAPQSQASFARTSSCKSGESWEELTQAPQEMQPRLETNKNTCMHLCTPGMYDIRVA